MVLEETEIVNVVQSKPPVLNRVMAAKVEMLKDEPAKMDTRYFGELLADVYRKNCDIHSCISEHVAKIRGQ